MCVLCCKQKTAYDMRISDWSSDVCSSDLGKAAKLEQPGFGLVQPCRVERQRLGGGGEPVLGVRRLDHRTVKRGQGVSQQFMFARNAVQSPRRLAQGRKRSEEHTSELQSLMRISYAVFCLKKKNNHKTSHKNNINEHTYKESYIMSIYIYNQQASTKQ